MDEPILQQIQKIIAQFGERLRSVENRRINQQMILPAAVKQRHSTAWFIFSGLASERPVDGSTEQQVFWSTDTHILSIWDSTAKVWRTVTLS